MEKNEEHSFLFFYCFVSNYFQSNQSGFKVIHLFTYRMRNIFNQISKKCSILQTIIQILLHYIVTCSLISFLQKQRVHKLSQRKKKEKEKEKLEKERR